MTFSKRMDRIRPSAIRSVQKKIAAKEGVISFAAGLPDPALFPLGKLSEATSDMIKDEGRIAFQYGLTKGYAPLIDIIAARMQKKGVLSAFAENIIITAGSQQGLALCAMMFLDEGDMVVCENPSYLGGINACRPYGVEFAGVNTDENGIDTIQLDEMLSSNGRIKMIYVIPNFQNPTGKEWSKENREDFMKVIEKHDVIVVEDDPYGELRFAGTDKPILKSMDTQGKVIYLGSFSKVMAPGLRLAWMCADKKITAQAELIKEGWDLQSNQFSQLQMVRFMEENDLDEHIDMIRKKYRRKCNLMLQQMELHFPADTFFTKPYGGMFIWVELPYGIDAELFLEEALEAGIAFIPGKYFFANEGADNTVRMNFTTVSEEEITKGIEIMGNLLKKKK